MRGRSVNANIRKRNEELKGKEIRMGREITMRRKTYDDLPHTQILIDAGDCPRARIDQGPL